MDQNPKTMRSIVLIFILFIISTGLKSQEKTGDILKNQPSVEKIFERIRDHEFNPLDTEYSMTLDRHLQKDGIADLNDRDWKVRLLAVRDLIRAGVKTDLNIIEGLQDPSMHVRYVSAMALGIIKSKNAIDALEEIIQNDKTAIVRSQAAIALGQIEAEESLNLLRDRLVNDPSGDVRHQCELAIYQIENNMGATEKQISAWLSLDESTFESVETGARAPDFSLDDTDGQPWHLNNYFGKQWVVLIWVFADWCPVCHGEFHELIELREEIQKLGIQVFTLEAHDIYRGRVMVGKELEPEYWFSKNPFKEEYMEKIYWPHLLDRAGQVGAIYGADPLAFSVHAEYINRPVTVIVDDKGIVRFRYIGTFWGDRPSVKQTLEMIKSKNFQFEHPKRRKNN